MSKRECSTRHQGFAAFLRFVLGDDAHTETEQTERGFIFRFDDPESRFAELESAFFSEEGAGIGDARSLLENAKAIRAAVKAAADKNATGNLKRRI